MLIIRIQFFHALCRNCIEKNHIFQPKNPNVSYYAAWLAVGCVCMCLCVCAQLRHHKDSTLKLLQTHTGTVCLPSPWHKSAQCLFYSHCQRRSAALFCFQFCSIHQIELFLFPKAVHCNCSTVRVRFRVTRAFLSRMLKLTGFMKTWGVKTEWVHLKKDKF